MQHWKVYHSRDGYFVELVEVPWWALGTTWLAEKLDVGHILCGAGTPGWMWSVPLGKPKYEQVFDGEEPWLSNSVGSGLYDLFNRLISTDDRYGRSLYRMPVSDEAAAGLGWPGNKDD